MCITITQAFELVKQVAGSYLLTAYAEPEWKASKTLGTSATALFAG